MVKRQQVPALRELTFNWRETNTSTEKCHKVLHVHGQKSV